MKMAAVRTRPRTGDEMNLRLPAVRGGAARSVLLACVVGALAATGCGVSAVQPGHVGTMSDIANLQNDIEQQQGIMAGGSECHDRCRAAESICDSASRICEIASDLAEFEALESCRRAESICHEATRRVQDDCACP